MLAIRVHEGGELRHETVVDSVPAPGEDGALEAGTWRPVIDSVSPLSEAARAVETMATGQHFGKLVLSCS